MTSFLRISDMANVDEVVGGRLVVLERWQSLDNVQTQQRGAGRTLRNLNFQAVPLADIIMARLHFISYRKANLCLMRDYIIITR